MKYRVITGIMLTLLFTGMLTLTFRIQPVKAWTGGTIYIQSDGSVYPPGAPISSADDITYTLTDDIISTPDNGGAIVVERDNIVVDGAGYTLQGTGSGKGIELSGRSNVTIKNMEIKTFEYGIHLSGASNNIIQDNNVTANTYYGIRFRDYSDNNIISGNSVTNNYIGIWLYDSSKNSVYRNDITNNTYGIRICFCAPNNTIYHNNFIRNNNQAYSYNSTGNVWDNGYPSGGNYWSDYTDVDFKSGPYQNVTGSDLIWDHPYVIDENNQDNYPPTEPWGSPTIMILSPQNKTYTTTSISLTFTVNKVTPWIGYSLNGQANVTTSGNTTLTSVPEGSNSIVVYANDTWGNMGTSSTVYFTAESTAPNITSVTQIPLPNNVLPDQAVRVLVNVTDAESGVRNVILSYTTTNGTLWTNVTMTYNSISAFYEAMIPAFPARTNVCYKIVAYDNAGNVAVNDNAGQYYCYQVDPPPQVGGIYIPVNKFEWLAPYIGLTVLLAVAVITVGYVKKRRDTEINS